MKLQFQLKKPKSKNETSIRLVIYIKGERLVYSIGENIHPDLWDSRKDIQRAIIPRGDKVKADQCRDINIIIERVKDVAIKGESELKRLGTPVIAPNLKEYISKELGESKSKMTLFFDEYLEGFISDIQTGVITTEHGKYSLGTIRPYNSLKIHLTNYQNKYKLRVRFDRLNADFYNKYKSYLIGESLKPNTIGKDIKNIKVIARRAKDSGITVNDQFEKFKTIAHTIDVPYLNIQELATIEGLDLTDNPRLDNARDIFILLCWTGLRYSDVKNLNEKNLVKNNTRIKVTTQKTSKLVEIPVFEPVKRILAKNNGFPRMVSNPKLNDYVKDVCEEAKINESVDVMEMKNGMEVIKQEPKHSTITVHTARRSFATNLYNSGKANTRDIMEVTGHKTESSFYRYIRITPEESADRLQEVDISLAPLKAVK